MTAGNGRSLAIWAVIFVVVLALVAWYTAVSEGGASVLAHSFLRSLLRAFF